MPAVPPCLTEKSVLSAECRHTPCPSRRHHVLATWQIPFTSPSEAHLLKLHFIRITPPRTLWETVPQFYFLVFGLFLFIWYGHILPLIFCVVNYFLKTFLYFYTNYLSEAVFIYIHKAGHKACLLSGFFTAACNLPAVIAVRMICMTVKRH